MDARQRAYGCALHRIRDTPLAMLSAANKGR